MAVHDPPLDSHASSSHASTVSTAEFQGRHGGCCVVASPFRQQQQKHPRHTSVLLALCLCKRPKQVGASDPRHCAGPAAAASPATSAHGLPDLATASFSDLASAHGMPEPSDASFSELAASARLPPSQQRQQQQQQSQLPQQGNAASLSQFAPRLLPSQQQPQRQPQKGHVAPTLGQVLPRRRHSAAQQAVLHAIFEITAEYDRSDAARAHSSSSSSSAHLQSSSEPCNTSSSGSSSDSSSSSSSEGSVDAPSSSIYELLFGQAGASTAAAAAVAAGRATLNSSSNSSNELRPLLSQGSAAGSKSAILRSGSSTDSSVSSADPAGSAQRSFSPLLRFTINPLYNSPAAHSSISSSRILPSPAGTASPLTLPPPAAATAAAHAPYPYGPAGSPNNQLLAMQLLSEVCRASTVFRGLPSGNGSTISQAGSDSRRLVSNGSNGGNSAGMAAGRIGGSSGEGGGVNMLAPVHAQHMLAPHSEPSVGGTGGSSGGGCGSDGASSEVAAGVADPVFLQHLLTALGLLGQQQQAGTDLFAGAFNSQQQQQEQEQQQQWYQYLAELSSYSASSSSRHISTYYTCQTSWSSGLSQESACQPAAAVDSASGTAAAAHPSQQPGLQQDSPYSSVCMLRQHSAASLGWATSGDNVLLGSPTISPVRVRVQAAPAAAVPATAVAAAAALGLGTADAAAAGLVGSAGGSMLAPGGFSGGAGVGFGQPSGLASVLNSILATAANQSGTPRAAAAAAANVAPAQQQQQQQQRLPALATLDSHLYATNSSGSSSCPAVMLSDLIAAACGGCGSNAGNSCHGSDGGSNGGSSSPDLVCLLGESEQLSNMSMGELRELLGRAAALSLAQLQRQQPH